MTTKEFLELREKLNLFCEHIMLEKGKVYTRDSGDKLANFKRTALEVGVSPQMVWAIFFKKHLDALMYFVQSGVEGPEGIESNIADARNYLDLLYGIIKEQTYIAAATYVPIDTMGTYVISPHPTTGGNNG